jgi:hypothetical protein
MLHEAEAAKPEDEESGDGEGAPVSVEVLLDGLMEHTIATKNQSLRCIRNNRGT